MRKILFVAQYAGSPLHGMVFGHYHLAKEWVRSGHEVSIVAASYAHARYKQPVAKGFVTEEMIDGVRYLWLKTPAYLPSERFARLWNILVFSVKCFFTRRLFKGLDLIICSSHHPLAIYPAKYIAQKFKAKLVFEVRDLWPLTLIEIGQVSERNPFIIFLQLAEKYAYKVADKVVSVLPHAADYMIRKGMDRNKFLFIPNGLEVTANALGRTLPEGHRLALTKLKDSGKFLVGYAGKIGISNCLDSLIDAIKESDDEIVHAVVLGDGESLPALKRKVKTLNIEDRVTFFRVVDRSQVGEFLEFLDVAYLGLPRKAIYKLGTSPTKLNDYLSAAVPVVYAVGEMDNAIDQSGAGIVCEPQNPFAIREAILKLKGIDVKERKMMGLRGRSWVFGNRNYSVLAQKFLNGVFSEQSR
jgi:glycosyltransferase involved in cell wall biosynthesis